MRFWEWRSILMGFFSSLKSRFGIQIPQNIELIHLKRRRWVEARSWPYLTLLGQGLGSIVLGVEAMSYLIPDVFIGTYVIMDLPS
jgi:alpha-1,2-mannosyltransferase